MNSNSSPKLKASAFLCAGISQLAAAEPPAEPMSVWFTVDTAWNDGKVTHHQINSPEARDVKLKINGSIRTERSQTR